MGRRSDHSTRPWRRATVRRRLLVERLCDRRVLAAITGAVFEDANFSFRQDAQESLLASRLVYIDANDNSTIDAGERFVVAEENGTFAFPNLGDGTYLLRLFNGTQTQQQTVPIEATIAGGTVAVSGTQLLLADGQAATLSGASIVIGDLDSGVGRSISVSAEPSKIQSLGDGALLAIGAGDSGDTAWIVDPAGQSSTPINLSGNGQSVPWSDVAIDGDGRGVLIERSDSTSAIRSLDASDSALGLQVVTTATMVPAVTQVLASQSGSRSVFAWSDSEGMQLSLWSNLTSTLITETPIIVAGTTEMLAYDDASGLLVMRTFDGGVSVLDVNQNFATLHVLSSVTGPVAIDGARDLLMTVSPIDAMLRLVSLRDGAVIADLAVDASTIGQIASLAIGQESDAVVVLGATGIAKVALNKAAANRVTIQNGQDVDSVLFGVSLSGINTSPQYASLPNLSTAEDVGFTKPAPAALQGSGGSLGAADLQGDRFVLVQTGPAANGVATVSINGDISYLPNDDYFGTDTVPVVLHDGRDVSAVFDLQISVLPTPDSPSGIDINVNPVPENILPGVAVGGIEVIDVDRVDNHIFEIDDLRFQENNGQIIFVGGDIDFETEPFIRVEVIVTDPVTEDEIDQFFILTVLDENDPITTITPTQGVVTENVPGDFAVTLEAEDQDGSDTHVFTVDDNRFVMDGADLRLADGVSVDFETTTQIKVNVTATDGGGSSLTEEITVDVNNVLEQPSELSLTDDTVLELSPGAEVGDVLVDGVSADARFVTSVDDSRFEIDGSTLKLLDDQFVERATQEEIQLTITVSDSDGEFDSVSDTFVIQVLDNQTPFHNDENPYDVDRSGRVTSLDALLVINYLNTYGPGPVGQGDPGFGYDVNGDGFVTALDALLILNEMNRLRIADTSVGEGEAAGDLQSADDQQADDQQADEELVRNENAVDQSAGEPDRQRSVEEQVGADRKSDGRLVVNRSVGRRATVLGSQHRSTPAEEFAASVDQTLRLLSDHLE